MPLPAVEVLYSFESTNGRGYSVIVHPAEKYVLLCDKDPEWWYVARDAESSDGGFYIPRTYVRLLPQIELSNRQSLITFRRPTSNRMSHVEILSKSYSIDPNGSDNSNNSSTFMNPDASASLNRHTSKNFGFKLADPERLSRSIPYDLNFIHNINNLTNAECMQLHKVNRQNAIQSPGKEEILPNGRPNSSQIMRSKSTKEHTDGPIYANLLCSDRPNFKPPSAPDGDNQLIKNLQDGWQMYEDCSSGRVFFYHPVTETSTWKPPRILVSLYHREDLGAHLTVSEDNGASFTTAECEEVEEEDDVATTSHVPASEIIEESFTGGNDHVDNLVPDLNRTVEDRELMNGHSNELQKDEIEKHSQEPECRIVSCVQKNCDWPSPPALPIRETPSESCTLRLKSPVEAGDQIENEQECNEKFESGSSTYNKTGALACLEESLNASRCRTSTQTVIRSGILNRCKFTESGKRAKKQWTPCFAYLTGAHLIFYKDEKAAEKKGNQYEAPMGVCDLNGASIEWLESDKMKKRRVFLLRPFSDASYMFYSDDNNDVVSWYTSISGIISCLPKPDINHVNPLSSVENSPSISKTHSRKLSNISSVFSSIKDADSHVRHAAKEKMSSDGKKSIVNMTCSLTNSLIDSESVSAKQNRQTILDRLRRFFFSRPPLELLKEKGIYKPEPVFGSSLIDICSREKGTVPKFLRVCTALIEEKGLDNDGLYRMSGNLSQVQKIRCQVDQDKYALLQSETDVHVLTGALKLFFRELPNSLFPVEMTKDFLNAIKLQEPKTRMKRFKELITKMPSAHRDCLDLLLKHLLRVAENAHKNRMQIHNLAIVFGPTLFSTDSNQKSNNTGQQNDSHRKKKLPLRNFHSANTTGVLSPSSISVMNKRQGASQQNSTPPVELIQSNSHLAFTMIMQGQIVEYMLKEYQKLLNGESSKPK